MSRLRGAADEMIDLTDDKSNWAVAGCFAKATAIGGTNGMTVT